MIVIIDIVTTIVFCVLDLLQLPVSKSKSLLQNLSQLVFAHESKLMISDYVFYVLLSCHIDLDLDLFPIMNNLV